MVAHVVGRVPADLTRLLAAKLPAYMVPGRVLPVDALPLTVNGKLDRQALARRAARLDAEDPALAHEPAALTEQAGRADRTAALTEQPGRADGPALAALVEIFADALPGSDVDADTDFFRAGGDSIVAITVVNRARALGLPVSPREVFLHRTPRALAAHLGTRTPRPRPPRPPATRTARSRRRRSSCAGGSSAAPSPGSPRPGRWRHRRAPDSPTPSAPRTPSWPRTRPSA
ncbi:phosphopantetheine-binding protein [Nonomuraea thailandensis]